MSPRRTDELAAAGPSGATDRPTSVMSAFTREVLRARCELPPPADHAATWSAGSERRMLALVVYVLLLWSVVVVRSFVW